MPALPREVVFVLAALLLQAVYRYAYDNLELSGPVQELTSMVTTLASYISSLRAVESAIHAASVSIPEPSGDSEEAASSGQDGQRAHEAAGAKDDEWEHLRGFPSDPQHSVNDWGAAYERHLSCGPHNASSTSAAWVARVKNYGLDPIGGDSWGVSITGAQLLASPAGGRELILHGGWDDNTGPRKAMFSLDVSDVVRTGRAHPVEIPVSFAAGAASDSACPGPAYGHTVTALGDRDEFLVLGGVKRGGYRGVSAKWGVFRLVRQAGSVPWKQQWLRCGEETEAKRAWHTATFVPAEASGDREYVLLCGGSENVVPVAIFEPHSGRFEATPSSSGANACKRAGHSAVLMGSTVYVLGGTSYLGPGMPWVGDDLADIKAFNGRTRAWRAGPARVLIDQLPSGLLDRQHTAVAVSSELAAVVAGGLGGGGAGGVWLLNFTALSRSNAGERGGKWARRLSTAPLPENCDSSTRRESTPGSSKRAAVPSAKIPPLRGQAAAWTGKELVLFGGAVAEKVGYHGMLLLRLLWKQDLST
eukprot:gnl/TRDRNA2_/TRDRNA2_164761_c0_seq2.p1 gnl/TRDRNA2_/TRDRNA2_164761_c0~~gnl/TRDRNA2_/TRDRNA2_164761_c0_seq2.p1  ORF type:complete len:554 (+),score=52.08 gnl/TRDRNA2_/TRDRNA2_164761_c0_seq2:67-1662(+)